MDEVQEIITNKLANWGYSITPGEMDLLLADVELPVDYTKSQVKQVVETALFEIIPELLLLPDITEGDYSVKRDKAGITQFYELLRTKLSIPIVAPVQPRITDKSNLW